MKNLFKARWMTSLIFLILLFVITGIAAPGFLTYDNIVTCFNTATMYTLLAVGIAFVIMTGEIDVSIGATLGLTAGMTGPDRPAGRKHPEDAAAVSGDGRGHRSGQRRRRFVFRRAVADLHPRHKQAWFAD